MSRTLPRATPSSTGPARRLAVMLLPVPGLLGFGAAPLGGCSARPQARPEVAAAAGLDSTPAPSSPGGDAPASPHTHTPKVPRPDYQAHVEQLRRRLPHPGFSIVIQEPFVVVGDEPRRTVERRARQTVKWSVDLLKRAYFDSDPDHIIDIWLFKDRASYQKHTRQLFKTVPTTPYGFYSARHRALIMNIATGGGTLVHEIVHPFVAANFAGCPAWFNEGLGSLYEQCREADGEIRGSTNWRLAGLQEALRAAKVPSFKQLTATTAAGFYEADPGTNYAQARYLLYYLQEHKLLRRYYKAFHAARAQDPTGYRTLVQVLGRADMAEFQEEWGRFVLQLRY